MTSISDCVLTATKQSCGDTRLRRHEVAKTRGCDSTERKITYKYFKESKEINETKLTTMDTEKLHDTYKTVATIIQ